MYIIYIYIYIYIYIVEEITIRPIIRSSMDHHVMNKQRDCVLFPDKDYACPICKTLNLLFDNELYHNLHKENVKRKSKSRDFISYISSKNILCLLHFTIC